ncbi:hypothetical protein niasHT_006028 [Heterodera trifolii]|uniref:Uncharacterized protein n=1 Tax=Heterodera trifolii TaxID=157864 RepID=A0ABD2M725_9BILA
MEPHFSTKHFVHHVEQLGKRLFTVTYDLKIPSPNFAPGDLFGHLLAQNKRPLPFYKEVRVKFEFVRDETRKFDAKLVALRIENALKTGENLDDSLLGAGANNSADDVVTTNCDHVMRNASMVELSKLITAESRMTEEMRSLVRARNFESPMPLNLTNIPMKFRCSTKNYELKKQVSINYSHQIEALNEQQRHEYRQLFASLASSFSCADDTFVQLSFIRANVFAPVHQPSQFSRPFQKSHSCDSKMMALTPTTFSDIGSIHHRQPVATSNVSPLRASPFALVPAQLKTMHNARILTWRPAAGPLADRGQRSNNTSNSNNMNANSYTAWHIVPTIVTITTTTMDGISARTDNN